MVKEVLVFTFAYCKVSLSADLDPRQYCTWFVYLRTIVLQIHTKFQRATDARDEIWNNRWTENVHRKIYAGNEKIVVSEYRHLIWFKIEEFINLIVHVDCFHEPFITCLKVLWKSIHLNIHLSNESETTEIQNLCLFCKEFRFHDERCPFRNV